MLRIQNGGLPSLSVYLVLSEIHIRGNRDFTNSHYANCTTYFATWDLVGAVEPA